MDPTVTLKQKQFFVFSFLIFFALIFLQMIGIFSLFVSPILWAIILALVFYPLYLRILKKLKGRKNLASLAVTALVVIFTLGPMVFFSGTLLNESLQFYKTIGDWIADKKYEMFWERILSSPLRILWDQMIEKTSALNIEIMPMIGNAMNSFSQTLVSRVQSGAKNFLILILSYALTIFILFFFFRDGEALVKGLKDLFPMAREQKEIVFSRLASTISAVVRGLVVTGVVQAILAGLAFWILGVPFPVFLSFLIAFLALVPIGGAILIWFPSAVYLFLSGFWIKALILFLWGGLVISTVDNFLKPLLIGERTKIPTLFLFLAILGGLFYYGVIGVFLGPVMLALFLTLIEIYRKEYTELPES